LSHQPNTNELIQASDHLFYEVRMLDGTSSFLFAGNGLFIDNGMIDRNNPQAIAWARETAKNAFLESFTVHMRNILEFILKPRVGDGKDDIISKHYMSEDNWNQMQKEIKGLLSDIDLDELKKRVNTEIVHLSFERNKLDYKAKQWEYLKLRENVLQACLIFYKYADKELFSENSKNYFDRISQEYRKEH